MLTSSSLIQRLRQVKIVPVITLHQAEDILPLGDVLADNGLPVVEITLRTAVAPQAIHLLRTARPNMLVGAGTVLNQQQAQLARAAGAQFIVSPGLNPNTVAACQQLGLPSIPGVNNPSHIEHALELGIELVKFFPAEASGGVNMLKALLGPYHQLKVMPTGGITLHTIQHYLAIPQVVACGGAWMVSEQLIATKQWGRIAALVQETCGVIA